MSLTTAGLTDIGHGRGVTPHYSLNYDTAVPDGAPVTNGLLAECEADFDLMQGWFNGIDIPFDYPLAVNIYHGSGGASWRKTGWFLISLGWGSFVSVNPLVKSASGNSVWPYSSVEASAIFLRYLLVSEVSEMLMMAQRACWFTGESTFDAGDEGSRGEGMSRFLGEQMLVHNGLGSAPPGPYAVTESWLNPPVIPNTRANFIDNSPDDHSTFSIIGCTTLFLYYLHYQLGKPITDIIDAGKGAGSQALEGVYKSLTGDQTADGAWVKFSELVNKHYPLTLPHNPGNPQAPETLTAYHPGGDNLFPVSNLSALSAPNELTCGYPGNGEVSVDNPAMAEIVVQLSSSDVKLLTVPDTVTIPTGSKSIQFPIQTVAQNIIGPPAFISGSATITARYAGATKEAAVTVAAPSVSKLGVAPGDVICGDPATGTVTLDMPPLDYAAEVIATTSGPNADLVQPQSPVTISKNADSPSQTFAITTTDLTTAFFTPKRVLLSASVGTQGKTKTFTVNIVTPTVKELTVVPDTVPLGGSCSAIVTLDRAAKFDIHVEMVWSGGWWTQTPSTVNIPAGQTTSAPSDFVITAPPTLGAFGSTQARLNALYAGTTVSAELTLEPSAETGVLASLFVPGHPIAGGTTVTGSVSLVSAVSDATVVTLVASPTVRVKPGSTIPLPKVSVPSSITIPAGDLSAEFPIATEPLPPSGTDRTVSIAANAFVTKTAILTFSV